MLLIYFGAINCLRFTILNESTWVVKDKDEKHQYQFGLVWLLHHNKQIECSNSNIWVMNVDIG